MERKYWMALAVLVCVAIGIASASLIGKQMQKPMNILSISKNECPGIILINKVDSSGRVRPISVAGNVELFGERVPLEDPDVLERLERELQINVFWHSNTLMGMKNANRYFGEIEKVLLENEVHPDFKYLALIESGLRNETSGAGAVGFWQLLKETAKIYGLEVSSEVDERYNYEKSTVAACKYLLEARKNFGSWTTSAASYNLGIAGMRNRIADQKTSDFYKMYFNTETSRYIFRILAMKIIFSQPEAFGFVVRDAELYQPYLYKTVEVDTGISSVADFAAQYGLMYKHIKILNPWLREAKLTNSAHKKYQIKVMQPE